MSSGRNRTGSAAERRMRRVAAAAVLAAGLIAAPASAQWFAGEPPIPASAVVMRLLQQGFSGVSAPRFDGSVYTLEATNRGGTRVRLVIDAFDGDVLARRRLDEDLRPPLDVGPRRFGRGDPFDAPEEIEPRGRYGTVERPPWSPDERPRYGRPDRMAPPEEAPFFREPSEPRDRTGRTEPLTRRPAPPSSRPEGARATPDTPVVTPTAPAPAVEAPRLPPSPAAPPATAALPAERPPAVSAPPPALSPPRNERAANPEPVPPNRTVRVIEGVTPVMPKSDPGKPAE